MAKLKDKMFNRVIEGELEAQDEIKSEVEALRDNGELGVKNKVISFQVQEQIEDEIDIPLEYQKEIKKYTLFYLSINDTANETYINTFIVYNTPIRLMTLDYDLVDNYGTEISMNDSRINIDGLSSNGLTIKIIPII